MNKALERIKNGVITENVTFVQVIAMCPVLAITTSVKNSIGMGIAATIVLIGSNFVISLLRNFIPDKVRIPSFIVIIASFVTILDFLMKGYAPTLYKALGIFIPLIVVNCLILGRAEAYASKNPPLLSVFDGIGQGLGFTLSLVIVGTIREIIGAGTFYGLQVLPNGYTPCAIIVSPPGAFLTLGILMAILSKIRLNKKISNKRISDYSGCGHCPNIGMCHKA